VVRILLPPYLLVSHGALIAGFGVVIACIIAVTQHTDMPANPFVTYDDVLPGHTSYAVEQHGFTCRDSAGGRNAAATQCNLPLETGRFTSIEVMYTSEIIRRTNFLIRDSGEHAMTVGELLLFLDAAKYHPRGIVFFAANRSASIERIAAHTDHVSLLADVSAITFTGSGARQVAR
jgi:hypothetical protein